VKNSTSNTSVTFESELYPNYRLDAAGSSLPSQLANAFLAATIVVSPALTLSAQTIPVDSATSVNLGGNIAFRTRKGSPEAISAFSKALQQRSYGLSPEDAQLFRQIVLAKSKPGIPHF
jgi:hypothetical protein